MWNSNEELYAIQAKTCTGMFVMWLRRIVIHAVDAAKTDMTQ